MIKSNCKVICGSETCYASSHRGDWVWNVAILTAWKSDLWVRLHFAWSRGSPEGISNDLQRGAWDPFSKVTLPAKNVDKHIYKWWQVFADLGWKGTFFILLQWLFIRALYSSLGNHYLSITSLLKSEVCPHLPDSQVTPVLTGVARLSRGRIWLFQTWA